MFSVGIVAAAPVLSAGFDLPETKRLAVRQSQGNGELRAFCFGEVS